MSERPRPALRPSAGVLLAAAACAVVASTTFAQAPADESPARYAYFDTFVELDVDPSMIAVFVDAFGADADARLAAGLADAGFAAAPVQPSSSAGWSYVVLDNEAGSIDAALAAATALHATDRFDMVSPVYLGQGGLPYVPTRDVLVQFHAHVPLAERLAVLAEHDLDVIRPDYAGTPGLVLARSEISDGRSMLEFAARLNGHPATVFAQSDAIYWVRQTLVPNDPQYPSQWALNQANDQDMDAPEAWDLETGDASIHVVVLDSGIQQNHPDITQLPGATFSGGSGGGPIGQCDNHGTAVAGCVAATINNGTGVVGIAPDARVRSGKIFNEVFFIFFCLPFLESQDSWTVAGINWAADSGARVTNSSWGGGTASAAITSAFNSTRAEGVIHFAAAGNDGTSVLGYPANLSSVNAVSALTSAGTLASFSTYGSGTFIAAPGAAVLTTDRTGGDGYASGATAVVDGTSFASPYAAGVAALVLSANPALTPDEVEQVMADAAVDLGASGYDTVYGWGFVNARNAVELAGGGGVPGDLDADGVVGPSDLAILLSQWGTDGSADFDDSGAVDAADLAFLLANWS